VLAELHTLSVLHSIYHALLLFFFQCIHTCRLGAGGRGVYCCFVFESHTYTHAGSGLQGGYPDDETIDIKLINDQ